MCFLEKKFNDNHANYIILKKCIINLHYCTVDGYILDYCTGTCCLLNRLFTALLPAMNLLGGQADPGRIIHVTPSRGSTGSALSQFSSVYSLNQHLCIRCYIRLKVALHKNFLRLHNSFKPFVRCQYTNLKREGSVPAANYIV